MDQHFCQRITKWPEHQDDTTEYCGAPATIKDGYEGIFGWVAKWLCAEHYDQVEKSMADFKQSQKEKRLNV